MNIIFGSIDNQVVDKYTVLELDTIKTPSGKTVPHWCLIEHVPLDEFSMLDINKELHANLIENYKKQNWDFCRAAIESLKGKWNGDVDTFYDELSKRIENFIENPPNKDWDGCYIIEVPEPAHP